MTFLINRANHIQIPAITQADLAQRFKTETATNDALFQTSGVRVAQLAHRLLAEADNPGLSMGGDISDSDALEDCPIVVVASVDEIGAVGLIAARHLEEWGAWVQVVLTQPPDAAPAATTEATLALDRLLEMGVSTAWAEDGWELPPADLVIDAMGIHANQDMIQLVNSHHAPALSVGSPSGVDPDSGEPSAHAIAAAATLALGVPLGALASERGRPLCGARYLADIGFTNDVYTQLTGQPVEKSTLFDGEEIIALETVSKAAEAD